MKKYSVYVFTFPDGKRYVGSTSNIKSRWSSKGIHYRWKDKDGVWHNQPVRDAIEKFGWDNIRKEVVFESTIEDEARQKETELIEMYKVCDREFGYNGLKGPRTSEKPGYKEEEKRKRAIYTKIWKEKNKEKVKVIEQRYYEKHKDDWNGPDGYNTKEYREKLKKKRKVNDEND